MSFFGDLDFEYRRTAAVSAAQTPKAESILLEIKGLSAGVFGKVARMWDVSTGRDYTGETMAVVNRARLHGIRGQGDLDEFLDGICIYP